MEYGVLDGQVYLINQKTGERSEMGWIKEGITLDGTDPVQAVSDGKLVSSFPRVSWEFKMVGRAAKELERILYGLPYRHPRQILHKGKKPTQRKRR